MRISTKILSILFLCSVNIAFAQNIIKGKVFDATTKEAIIGASISAANSSLGTTTDGNGNFSIKTDAKLLTISFVGFQKQEVKVEDGKELVIALEQSVADLQQVVVTANREASLRSEAPVAISKLSSQQINDTKPNLMVELMNQISGVMMVNLGNEQHEMSIRQPMTTNPYYQYMEDGLSLRPMGVFNHNSMIETNIFSVSSIEVIKGPASSLYGPEAVGGAINVITHRPTAVPVVRIGVQGDNYGYKRVQFAAGGMLNKKFGVFVSGYDATQRNGWMATSDYDKFAINLRADYNFSDKTRLIGAYAYEKYNSQMGGSVDSTAFYNRTYLSQTPFAYRKVDLTRASLRLEHTWNSHNESFLTVFHRNNDLGQDPSYSIVWKAKATTATGQINDNSFKSYGFVAQNTTKFDFLSAKLIVGATFDYSPNSYYAYQTELTAKLRPDGNSVESYALVKEDPTIFLSKYDAKLHNSAAYAQFEINPMQNLKLVAGGRFDKIQFDFQNYVDGTSGSKTYQQFTPKIGATYNLGNGIGIYANYSNGFSPPPLTSIFKKRPAPAADGSLFYYNLEPAVFNNYEIGGWASLAKNKVYLDWALYEMDGLNEVVGIKQPDNTTDYQSAGKTLHRGIEYSFTYKPNAEWTLRFSGTNALHKFVEFTLSQKASDAVKDVNGKEMPNAPHFIANTQVTYKPLWAKGLRLGIEWQAASAYYENQVNTVSYNDKGAFGFQGISVLNLRAGYQIKGIEFFTNILNLTDELYSTIVTRGNLPTNTATFTPAAPRTFVMGLQYNFSGKK